MKTTLQILLFALALTRSTSQASEISDTTPPRLVSLELAPAMVGNAEEVPTVSLSVRIADDLAGLREFGPASPYGGDASIWFRSSAPGWAAVHLGVSFNARMRASGDELDGVYTNVLVLPRYAHAGTWTLAGLRARDAVGNQREWSLAEVLGLGFPASFTVQGTDDRTPPELVSLLIAPLTVDTSRSNQAIRISVRIRDGQAGLDRPPPPVGIGSSVSDIRFVSPSKQQYVGTRLAPQGRESGDAFDGVYTNTIWLPRYSEPGTWSLEALRLVDAAGNEQQLGLAEFLDRGLPATFTVQGLGDTAPPQLRGIELSPRWISTTHASQTIAVTARLADNIGGLSNSVPSFVSWGWASATFVSPSKAQVALVYFPPNSQATGTDLEGVFINAMVLPRYSETGVWTLREFNLQDGAGNNVRLEAAEVRWMGFPTEFAVGTSPSLEIARQADSLLLSWPAWASGFILEAGHELGPSGRWEPLGLTPAMLGDQAVVAVPASARADFYRLVVRP